MPPPDSPTELPDPDVLATQAVDRGRPDDARKRAFAGLNDLIGRLAVSLSIRLCGRVHDDLAGAAAGEIYLRLDGYKPGGSFVAWCHRTLHNWMVDELRKETRRREREREAAKLRAQDEPADEPPERLTPQITEAMNGWPLGQRLVLLCLTGLWREVPHARWREWWSAYSPGGEPCLTDPFPPGEFEMCPDAQERADLLAQLLRIRRGTLAVWVHRCTARLRSAQSG
jgi:DNA-directed RNA polymerase specialized sigma24 family protein